MHDATRLLASDFHCPLADVVFLFFAFACSSSVQGKLVVRTDPKNHQYVMFSGLRGKAESFSAADNDTIELPTDEEKQRRATDALFRLEHGERDKERASRDDDQLQQLYDIQKRQKDDYGANQALRRANREARKASTAALQAGAAKGLPFALLPAATSPADEDALGVFHKRRALQEHARTLRRESRKKRRISDNPLLATAAHTAAVTEATAATAAESGVMSSSPVTPSSLTPSFAPSAMMPLAPIRVKATTAATPTPPTHTIPAATIATPLATPAPPAPPPTTHVLGLAAYESDEEE